MSHRLKAGNAGSFYIQFNNANTAIPFQRGSIIPVFELDINNVPTGKMRFRDSQDINRSIINYQPFGEFINDSTGVAFASLVELVSFCVTNIFMLSSGGSGGTPSNTRVWKIKAVPVAPDEKPIGASLQDDMYKTDVVTTMIINTDIYTNGVNMGVHIDTGTIGTDGNINTFVDGDIVIVNSYTP